VIENMKASDLSLLSQAIHWPSFKEVTTKYWVQFEMLV
jgi:hypothetical protein